MQVERLIALIQALKKMRIKNKNSMRARLGDLVPMVLIFLLGLFPVFSGCSKKQLLSKNSNRQHYVDVTKHYLPKISGSIERAKFARVDKDSYRDLILQVQDKKGGSRFLVLRNKNGRGFEIPKKNKMVQVPEGKILFFDVGDLNKDFADDIVIIQKTDEGNRARILFNNKKGYFYKKVDFFLPEILSGIDRVKLVDLDHDHDLDLFFYGEKVVMPDGRPASNQAQVFINNGKGEFQDLSSLLLTPVPPGIVGVFFADYSGDGIRDIFLTYRNGRDRLLFNNGLGKFTDNTQGRLPVIKGETTHADWADFDGDGDNDLLVLKRQAQSKETGYFLENNGEGRFTKRSAKALTVEGGSRVYLLDANGNSIPDALILKAGTTHFLQGQGEWKFSVETIRRLPHARRIMAMAFGDFDDDGYLDIFGIDSENRKGKLWLNRFN
ncbi:hypothetical protein MNBD_NITROSPINAE05-718 [hydrothermal vent metagenome]|uniref:VCBS repeat-containing protein n=1 Tax=hydrothermal vent metagenome TaxID=652676 RepID=A0A3B1CJD1_9ZZZZ